ncbi:molybdopterin molybdenumtransferase MoeA [Halomonas sp. ZH2S]|uniref:Molybdopterin molybdenumtransferase n=1 Tax=Vreelandella zhuhanensis TaxID=2684210 RepID=A0A7X3H1V2_9GAMM|nr:gephyrin-like molybdotransferase Glp [Halomonas zhuhanensis]MWJ29002.1 molybdopterin molybdenumtransferase MoeA [Halomonas zhuhanensis]
MNCGCADNPTTDLLDLWDARARLIEAAVPLMDTETLPLSQAAGRVLAISALAALDLPSEDNSAMDGYAMRLAELEQSQRQGDGLPVLVRVPAGAGVMSLPSGGCARIFTGAPVPQGADVVVPQERVHCDEQGRVHVAQEVTLGANIRRRGEEARYGDLVLAAGERLSPAAIGLLASHGIAEVVVKRRLRVALLSTGDELIEPGTPRVPGQVYNSNAAMLKALLAEQGCEVVDKGIIADTAEALRVALSQARDSADMVICTGGVSVGEEDHVRPVLDALGSLYFHGIALKPGKPFTFGTLHDVSVAGVPLIGLPGNPVASLVGWQFLTLPFVQGCQGRSPHRLERFTVKAGFAHRANRQRYECLRVVLEDSEHGPVALLAGGQGSHMLSAAAVAHGYLIIDPSSEVKKGDDVTYCPCSQFLT